MPAAKPRMRVQVCMAHERVGRHFYNAVKRIRGDSFSLVESGENCRYCVLGGVPERIDHLEAGIIQHVDSTCHEDHDPTNFLCTCSWETLPFTQLENNMNLENNMTEHQQLAAGLRQQA